MVSSNSKPRRVLHLVQGLGVGGLEYMVVELINRLDRSRFLPSVCCFDISGKLMDRLQSDINVTLLKRKSGKDLFYPFKLAALLKKENIDIIHAHNQTAYFYGVLGGKIAGTDRIVYTEHARDAAPNIKIRVVDKILSYLTDRIVVVAGFLKTNLEKREWINSAAITTIYNGIDGEKFAAAFGRSEVLTELNIAPEAKIIGIVARLQGIKNHRCLIKAMGRVTAAFPDAVLLIVGDGPLRQELEVLVGAEKLQNSIHFLGARNDIPRLFSVFDIFVLCSLSEGLPLTILEAMAAGKPIVATAVGGIPEVIQDGVDGIIIPSNDPDQLAEAILKLLRDKGKRRQMGEMARRKFEEKFTIEAMVMKYEELYEGGKFGQE